MKPPDPTLAALDEELLAGSMSSAARVLPAGTRLDEFEVGEIIGEGDATIVYAATDRALGVPVAIAEYMPERIAQRKDAAQVASRTSAQADAYAKGLKAFINETQALARCDHPSLVRILGLLEANGTAYRVMPRYVARRLLEVRQDMAEPPDETALRALLDALLGALEAFHRAKGFHGKVTPSNILLLADDRPLLLSPGAAGRAIASDRIDALITSPEPSFAPVEQILESADTPLSPSVDLYALAGVARYCITGQLPAPAFGARDPAPREPLADIVQRLRLTWPRLHYSESLLDALESALSIYPAERPQTVAQMRARLGIPPPLEGGPVAAPALNDAVRSSPLPQPRAAQDLDAVKAFAPNPEPLRSDSVTRVDEDLSARAVFAGQVRSSRRVAMWSGAVVLLLALVLVGTYGLHEERRIGPVLDFLGIGSGTGLEDSATVSASAEAPASVTPPIAADAGTSKSMPTEAAAVDAGPAKSMPTEGAAADSPPSTAAPQSPAGATPQDKGASAEPAAVVPRPAPSPPPTSVAKQRALRAPDSPRAACGARTRFSLYRCMQTQCSQRHWASHPQCERLRATDSVD